MLTPVSAPAVEQRLRTDLRLTLSRARTQHESLPSSRTSMPGRAAGGTAAAPDNTDQLITGRAAVGTATAPGNTDQLITDVKLAK